MAEFMNHPRASNAYPVDGNDGFAAMGKPVPEYRKQNGYAHCKDMGLDKEMSFRAVSAMCVPLERDEPYDAMAAGMKFLDLTGTYRLMAVLLTGDPPEAEKEPEPNYTELYPMVDP